MRMRFGYAELRFRLLLGALGSLKMGWVQTRFQATLRAYQR
ncbi:MAG: hypothetical protein ACFNNL_10225 [Kingella oralis]